MKDHDRDSTSTHTDHTSNKKRRQNSSNCDNSIISTYNINLQERHYSQDSQVRNLFLCKRHFYSFNYPELQKSTHKINLKNFTVHLALNFWFTHRDLFPATSRTLFDFISNALREATYLTEHSCRMCVCDPSKRTFVFFQNYTDCAARKKNRVTHVWVCKSLRFANAIVKGHCKRIQISETCAHNRKSHGFSYTPHSQCSV